jgi:hypothetical protein
MASKRKNSLVANINRRKRAGKSRPKSRSTVSKESYDQMERGWPQKASRKNKTTSSRKRPSPKNKSTGKKSAKNKAAKKRAAKKRAATKRAAKKRAAKKRVAKKK